MTPYYSPICDDPKNIHKIFIPRNIYFSENPQNIEIQNFEPKKWPEPTYVWIYQCTPLGTPQAGALIKIGSG